MCDVQRTMYDVTLFSKCFNEATGETPFPLYNLKFLLLKSDVDLTPVVGLILKLPE